MDNKTLYQREGYFSIIINTILFFAKYIIGTMTGSVAIIADGIHSLTDSLSSVVVIVGSKMSKVPPDKKHPFGHGRIEAISSVVISLMLFLVSYEFIRKSIAKLTDTEITIFSTAAYVITIASIIIKEMLTWYARSIYKKTKSELMKAEAVHHRSDSLSSLIVLAGIFAGKFFWWSDAALGIIVSIMISYAAYGIIKNTISSLIGESLDDVEIKKMKILIKNAVGIDLMSHHYHLHSYGDHKELTLHIRLDGEMSLTQAHCITELIEKKIQDETGYEVTVHAENIPAENE